MESKEKHHETEPEPPEKPVVQARPKGKPEVKEKERPRYSSPSCMMGELDEIMDV